MDGPESPVDGPAPPTAETARELLATAARPSVTSWADRRAHALVALAAGLMLGLQTVVTHEVGFKPPGSTVVLTLFCLAFYSLGAWQRRRSSSPRNTKVLWFGGFLLTLPLMMIAGLTLLSAYPNDAPLWAELIVVMVVAVPFALIGRSILRDGSQ